MCDPFGLHDGSTLDLLDGLNGALDSLPEECVNEWRLWAKGRLESALKEGLITVIVYKSLRLQLGATKLMGMMELKSYRFKLE